MVNNPTRVCLVGHPIKSQPRFTMKKSVFINIVGNSSRNRLLEFMIEGREWGYLMSDIARGSELQRNTCYNIIKSLVKQKVITKEKKWRKYALYKINQDNSISKILIKCFDDGIDNIMKSKI